MLPVLGSPQPWEIEWKDIPFGPTPVCAPAYNDKIKRKKSVSLPIQTQFLLQTKSLVETINTSTGVNQLLLAGIERVALGADFNTDLLLGGAGGEGVAASATDGGLLVLRMDAFFHVVHLFLVS